MIDNKKVKSSSKSGIERVKQRKGDMEVGQSGKMGTSSKRKDTFKRSNSAATPRKA